MSAAIFSFDEGEYTESSDARRPRAGSNSFKFLDDPCGMDNSAEPSYIRDFARITVSTSSTGETVAIVREPEIEEEDEDKVGDLTAPVNIKARNNPVPVTSNGLPSSYGSRLGTSYEVGIEEPYISSLAQEEALSEDEDDESVNGELSRTISRHSRTLSHGKPTPADFEPLKVLGQGAYGKVLLVREKATGRLYAQKQLKKASMIVEKKKIEQTKTEKAILESVRHPYIVKLFYALQDHHKLYLILEYAQGGELFTHLASERMFSEDVTSFYVAEMILALVHLHTNVGVVYRDLKPENCLLDYEGHLVLTDFGLSKVAEDGGECKTFLGTPEYMAPEILLGKSYDYAVDWWSLGAVCYDLLTGSPPFPGNNHKKIIDKITKSKLTLPYYLSADAKDFLVRLLRKEPKKRLGYKQIDTIKKHRFFRKVDWKKLEVRDPDIVPPIVPVITDPILAENFPPQFTEMMISPDDRLTRPIAINGQSHDEHQPFAGFSFTASPGFINRSIAY